MLPIMSLLVLNCLGPLSIQLLTPIIDPQAVICPYFTGIANGHYFVVPV